MRKFLILAVLMSLFAVAAHAQVVTNDEPLLSAKRLVVGAGLNNEWSTSDLAGFPPRQWTGGIYAAYALTANPTEQRVPRISLIGSSVYGISDHATRYAVGVRVTLFDGSK